MERSGSKLTPEWEAFRKLEAYAHSQEYKGWDPYDVLTSPFPFRKLGKWPPILAIQITKRNPVNLRRWLGIPKMWNPKALGLFLQGYSILPKSDENKVKCECIFEMIMSLSSKEIPGLGWGYPFPWASPEKYLPAWSPTAVVSGFVAQGLDAYYNAYGDVRALDALEQVCVFLSEGLVHSEKDDIYTISYSAVKPDFCYNASLLAAQTYALAFAHTGHAPYVEICRKAVNTVLSRQRADGSWNYSENLQTGEQRVQIDFHQGFILDSLMSISSRLKNLPESLEESINKGYEFYMNNQFSPDGHARWRLPAQYPADIHHQAQGIITASRYHRLTSSPGAKHHAKNILKYTMDNFYSPDGYFYYRKHRYFIDRTNYMRWGNAWMFLALAEVGNLSLQ